MTLPFSFSKKTRMIVLVSMFVSMLFTGIAISNVAYAESANSGCVLQPGKEKEKCDYTDDKLNCNASDTEINPDNCEIAGYLKLFINVLSGLVGLTVVIVLIVGGIQYTTSGGDANAVARARKRISNALLALVFFAFMYGFLQWIIPGGVL